jgi:FkbM family methyltransferase
MYLRKYIYYFRSIFTMLFGIENFPQHASLFLDKSRPRPTLIRLRKSGLQFHVRGAMDIWSVKEAFLDRFYEKFGTRVGEGWTVIDIGAGIGEYTLFAAHGHPRNVVYAFEPFGASFAILKENLAWNGVTNVHVFNEAIGAQTGPLALSTSLGEPLQFSTALPGTPQHAITVPAISLGDAFSRLKLERCNLLKLDCEGAEYEILFNAPGAILSNIDHIVMEYHDGVTPYTHQQLADFLLTKGFQVKLQPNSVHRHLGYLHAYRG